MEIISKNLLDLSSLAADLIEQKINSLEKDKITVAIPGGQSVKLIFEKLKEKRVDWNKVHFFMVDERLVDLNSPESNFVIARESLFQPLLDEKRIKGENIHPFIYTKDIEKDISKYESEFKSISDHFDIVILSSGEDGHVASLFPGNESLDSKEEYFMQVKNSPKPPAERMTASLKMIQNSDFTILLFIGESKRDSLECFKNKSIKLKDCPAKIVEKINSIVLTDLN